MTDHQPCPHDLASFVGDWPTIGCAKPTDPGTGASLDRIRGEQVASRARTIRAWLLPDAGSTARVVLRLVGVWESSEMPSLWWDFVDANRGTLRQHDGVRTFEFGAGEAGALESMLALVILFGWEACAAEAGSDRMFMLDHDGQAQLWGGDAPQRMEIAAAMAV
jgi:hypothetical protein